MFRQIEEHRSLPFQSGVHLTELRLITDSTFLFATISAHATGPFGSCTDGLNRMRKQLALIQARDQQYELRTANTRAETKIDSKIGFISYASRSSAHELVRGSLPITRSLHLLRPFR
jgi:hypothetical protein